MMKSGTSPTVPVAKSIRSFDYAIRNIVSEAHRLEATGRRVRYLNIGDPVAFGFQTPPHLLAAVERALRDGENGYAPSAGIPTAREAVAADFAAQGLTISPDRVVITTGTSEGIELALTALVDPGSEVLVPIPTYPLYTAVLAKIGARPLYYRTDPQRGWLPDFDHLAQLVTPDTRALVVIDPNNPTGAVYPDAVRRALLEFADHRGLVVLADEVYADLRYDGPVASLATLDLDAPVISFSSLSKAYLAPGWRTGWLTMGATDRLDDVLAAILKLADARICTPVPMQHAIVAALMGDRSHQEVFRGQLRERAELTTARLNDIPGMACVAPTATFYAMPQVSLPPGRTDQDYVLGLLRATGVLCVYGGGFGTVPEDGFFRVVFLASPAELTEIYDTVGAFTAEFLRH